MIVPEEGMLLAVNKPKEWTSFDVVRKLRNALKIKKIGHAGTLDPLATGLLLIGLGKYTKRINEIQALDKVYEGTIEIGKTTPSYDLEMAFDSEADFSHLTSKDITEAASRLTGEIDQIPPAHSAVKVDGERAYKKARKNEEVILKSRRVTVHSFELMRIELPEIDFRIHCTKGTYIRSLASDIGKILGVGGYLKELVRVRIGPYELKDAYELEELIEQIRKEREDR